MARGRRKEKPAGPQAPERRPPEAAANRVTEKAAADGAADLDRRLEALRERGDTAIKSFLIFLFGAPLLLLFAELLGSAADAWPHFLGGLADPMERVLSLADPKPVFAVQALALLVRAIALLSNGWRGNELLFDALDALYAVTFSLIGFLAGGGLFLAVFRLSPALLIVSIALGVMSFVVLVGIDVVELKMTPFLERPFWRVALALVYLVFAAVALLTNK